MREGRVEEGLGKLRDAVKAQPDDARFRFDLRHQQEQANQRLLTAAASERAAGHASEAEALYRRVLTIDENNDRAQAGLAALIQDRRHGDAIRDARALLKKGDAEAVQTQLRSILVEQPKNAEARALLRDIDEQRAKDVQTVPTLKSKYAKPITLEFRDANLKQAFDALSRTSGINFILDKDVKSEARTTIFVRQVSVEDTIDLMLVQNQLEKKILSENTVLVYPNSPQKTREYQDLVIKSFYLENADAKQTLSMVKTMLKTRDLFIDEKLNLLVMRDTPEAVRLAEKLIAMQDLAEPEVLLELEVLEVTRSRLLDLGIQWPDVFTLTAIPLTNQGTINDFKGLNGNRITVGPPPSATLNFKKRDGDTEILASPRIRVRNREKAKVLIGDRVPVISVIASPTTGGNAFFSDTIQYLDVGLKLDVEPNIYLDDEVAIKISLEVSTLGEQVVTKNGSTAFRIGTRMASTVLRLKDNETQVLMGLIRDDERKTADKVPGLGDLPLLGRLFSSHRSEGAKTEIILSITPRVVRNLKRANASATQFWSGTEANLRTQPLTVRPVIAGTAGPAISLAGPPQTAQAARPIAVQANQQQVEAAVAEPPAVVATAPAAASAATPAAGAFNAQSFNVSWQGPGETKVGDEFVVTLMAKAGQPVSGASLQLDFDPAALQVMRAEEGDFLRQNNAATSFSQSLDPATGKLTVRVFQTSGSGAAGEGSLVAVTFKAIAAKGQSELRIQSSVSPAIPGSPAVAIAAAPSYPLVVNP